MAARRKQAKVEDHSQDSPEMQLNEQGRGTAQLYTAAQGLLDRARELELRAQAQGDRDLQSLLADARKALGTPNALDVLRVRRDRP